MLMSLLRRRCGTAPAYHCGRRQELEGGAASPRYTSRRTSSIVHFAATAASSTPTTERSRGGGLADDDDGVDFAPSAARGWCVRVACRRRHYRSSG